MSNPEFCENFIVQGFVGRNPKVKDGKGNTCNNTCCYAVIFTVFFCPNGAGV